MTSKSVFVRIDVCAVLRPYGRGQRNRINFHRNSAQVSEKECRNLHPDRSCAFRHHRESVKIFTVISAAVYLGIGIGYKQKNKQTDRHTYKHPIVVHID